MATHTIAATAASASSVIIPAAPTITRCSLRRSAHALEASTYGTGASTRSMMPIVCTSPPECAWRPNFLHASA